MLEPDNGNGQVVQNGAKLLSKANKTYPGNGGLLQNFHESPKKTNDQLKGMAGKKIEFIGIIHFPEEIHSLTRL